MNLGQVLLSFKCSRNRKQNGCLLMNQQQIFKFTKRIMGESKESTDKKMTVVNIWIKIYINICLIYDMVYRYIIILNIYILFI